ncbi:hypothetical protein [Acetobacter sp.]|jgi:hypothetical protein|uniref:hypothetical protein n=1 Tax=Acetobacter sp. TaxID=440 RepID=UPI0025C16F7D|nr:hypothetical protein [Acetobacter sp.]MCH4090914.1 hypothetical protein [Acetobacter sp.]MCI1300755.1 hypothetical protein [Acetobacter sp.]MCI1317140.1 hypothetical protein [Acetobacter sp.]
MQAQSPDSPSDPHAGENDAAHDAAGLSNTDLVTPSPVPVNDPAPVVRSGAVAAVTPSAADDAASQDRMDGPAFRELAQMIGAMAFVALLTAAGWHAAHYSGAWPY